MFRPTLVLMLAGLLASAGCDGGAGADALKPTVAVMRFDNRAGSHMGWRVGDGLADVLVDRLVATGRFQVIERAELDAVLKELGLQHSGVTRPERRVPAGRVKNVQYLIKGAVTDFGHVSAGSGFFSGGGWDIFGRRARAVMGITLQVVDVESGQVICSESIQDSVFTSDVDVRAQYKGMAFGGQLFSRTPLGRATAGVIDKAVRRISHAIAARPWVPKIALVQADRSVVINGGGDQGFHVGAEYDVLRAGSPIFDPDTGDVLGHQPGQVLGRVRVIQVHQRHSVAAVVTGRTEDFQVGQQCRPVRPAGAVMWYRGRPARDLSGPHTSGRGPGARRQAASTVSTTGASRGENGFHGSSVDICGVGVGGAGGIGGQGACRGERPGDFASGGGGAGGGGPAGGLAPGGG